MNPILEKIKILQICSDSWHFVAVLSSNKKDFLKMDEDFVKKRLDKDLQELKRMIETHFQQRKKDEEELSELKDRIEKRKQVMHFTYYAINQSAWLRYRTELLCQTRS